MVGVGDKPETCRAAAAVGTIRVNPDTLARIVAGDGHKGDVLAVARLAAIGAAKQTASLIPLCHPVRLTSVDVEWTVDHERSVIEILTQVEAVDRTGPEMEAMTAASTGLLTVYDMCKAMDRGMVLSSVMLISKSGGKSGAWSREGAPPRTQTEATRGAPDEPTVGEQPRR